MKKAGIKVTNERHGLASIIVGANQERLTEIGELMQRTLENGLEFDFDNLSNLGINCYFCDEIDEEDFDIIKEYTYWC